MLEYVKESLSHLLCDLVLMIPIKSIIKQQQKYPLKYLLSYQWSILTRASQVLPLRILDLEIFYQNPLRTSRDDPWDH